MSKQVSILFTLKDNFTSSLKNISGEQTKFRKQLTQSSKELAALYDKKRQLQIDNRSATKSIKDTAKNAQKLGSDLQAIMKTNVEKKVKIQFEQQDVIRKIKDVEKNLNTVGKKKTEPTIKVKDQASSVISSISSKLGSLAKAGLVVGGAAIAGATAAAGAGIYQSLKKAGEMEQSRVAFETMLGSKDKSDAFLGGLSKFAIQTPFEFSQLQDSSKKMLAYGFGENDIIPTLTAIGNASAGLGMGSDGVDRITIALGQMRAKTKVSGDEMRQLTEAGIPAWEMLSEATGKSTADLMKLSENGAIPADKAIQALIKGMNKRFPDMMIKQSKTLFGLFSSIKDFINLNIFTSFGDGIRQGILPSLQRFTDGLTNNEERMKRLQDRLSGIGKAIGDFAGNKADSLINYFDKLFNNPAFMNADLGGKVKIVLNDVYTSIKDWFDNDGKQVIANGTDKLITFLIEAIKGSLETILPIAIELGVGLGEGIWKGIKQSILGKSVGDMLADAKEYQKTQEVSGVQTKPSLIPKMPDFKMYWDAITNSGNSTPSRAIGVNRVPYDNYLMLAHEGEQLLTKQEAKQQNTGSITIAKLADTLVIREEADIDKIADRLVSKVEQYSLNFGGVG